MIAPVKKIDNEYYVSIDSYLYEVHKIEEKYKINQEYTEELKKENEKLRNDLRELLKVIGS